ncbi:hypothetical protein DNTS_014873 [Danionella cerebrum]|uniref:Uncharacterized protein n=1 Tax=Danionella cerebrum TaxID=2873325 RepID=A0A553RC96_9TELE|nr:hypothetical protein DNTS_014873 [Danionella translucida]
MQTSSSEQKRNVTVSVGESRMSMIPSYLRASDRQSRWTRKPMNASQRTGSMRKVLQQKQRDFLWILVRFMTNFSSFSGPSPSLLAPLQSLMEDKDHMLFPHSLHQIAEGFFLEQDYKWAMEFLHLEKLYHERLLSNLASIQEKWESQRKARLQPKSYSVANREMEWMEVLSHICRTHKRPSLCFEKEVHDNKLQKCQTQSKEHSGSNPEEHQFNDEDENGLECWNKELLEDSDIDSQVPVEELERLIQVEEIYPSIGLVSILKKKICLEETENHPSTRRKVHFREPDCLLDHEDSSKNSFLMLLLMCLVTVVASLGGTALYCQLGESYSNVCIDFSQNMDFYLGPVQQTMDFFLQWLSFGDS